MNKTATYGIEWQGLKNGLHEFDYEITDSFFEELSESPIKGGRFNVHIRATKSASLLLLETHITGNATVECDRCLGDLSLPVDFQGSLTVRFSDTIDDYDGETLWLNPADPTVPLAQYLYESIVLSLPYRRIHGTDPQGNSLCDKDMLSRFKIVSQEDFDALEIQSNSLGQNLPNDELQQLKNMMNEEENI